MRYEMKDYVAATMQSIIKSGTGLLKKTERFGYRKKHGA